MYKPHRHLPCTPVCNRAKEYTQFMTMSADSCSKAQNRSRDFHTYKYNRPDTFTMYEHAFFLSFVMVQITQLEKDTREDNYPPNVFPTCYQTLLIYSCRTIIVHTEGQSFTQPQKTPNMVLCHSLKKFFSSQNQSYHKIHCRNNLIHKCSDQSNVCQDSQ